MTEIDTGDIVCHQPTGEHWVVAQVKDDKLSWFGWPAGWASLSDFTLVSKAGEEDRVRHLKELTTSNHHCSDWARDRLKEIQMADNKYPEPPDFEAVEQQIYEACRRFVTRDMLEPIHNLIRDCIDADRAMRAQAAPEYSEAMGVAGQAYFESVGKHAHPLPALVLFEDGYAEGWAKCLQACKAALAQAKEST